MSLTQQEKEQLLQLPPDIMFEKMLKLPHGTMVRYYTLGIVGYASAAVITTAAVLAICLGKQTLKIYMTMMAATIIAFVLLAHVSTIMLLESFTKGLIHLVGAISYLYLLNSISEYFGLDLADLLGGYEEG